MTGSHSAKFGTTLQWGESRRSQDGHIAQSQQLTIFGSPFRAVFNTFPLDAGGAAWDTNYMRSFGLYAQDQWTVDRLTINAGVRWDYGKSGYPDHTLPDITWGASNSFDGQDVNIWKDLSPRLGLVYDMFGNGRTALKVTANRYVDGFGTTLAGSINPAIQNSATFYTWIDALCLSGTCVAGDGIAQGDPRLGFPNGELLSFGNNPAFGTPLITEVFDEDWAFGWGKRAANWEFSGGVQHELVRGLSLNATYFRRIFTNFSAVNNRLQNPEDFDPYCVTIPNDNRLPNPGQELCGFYEVRTGAVGLEDDITTSADNFGKRTQDWNGVDFTVNARMDNGLLLQGGLSTGRTAENDCDLNANLNNPSGASETGTQESQLFCDKKTVFLTQVKFLGSYTLPYDIQISGTLQSLPGQELHAHVTYTSAQIEPSLGRPIDGGTKTIEVIDVGTEYGDRLLQFDLRVTKILNFGGARVRAMFDLYNVFNDSTALELNNQYAATGANWLRPNLIIPGRLAKFAFQLDF